MNSIISKAELSIYIGALPIIIKDWLFLHFPTKREIAPCSSGMVWMLGSIYEPKKLRLAPF